MKSLKTFSLAFFAIFLVFLLYISVFADSSGRTNRTRKTSTSGCSCHSSSSAISGVISKPAGQIDIVANQTYTFRLTITMPSGSGGYGVDIAAKRGTLAVVSGSGLKLVTVATGNELTHSSAISYSNPKVIQFSYTAPSTAGTDTIYANVDRGYSGAWAFVPNYGFNVVLTSGIENNSAPLSYELSQNYPNPFNPTTTINYSIIKDGFVNLKVYNLLGKEVATLVNEKKNSGRYSVDFNSNELSSGIYFYKLETNDFSEMRKMTLLK